MELHIRPTFNIEYSNALSCMNLVAEENGGGLCVYARENTTFDLHNAYTLTNTIANHGVI